jgi:hypothetical protein
MLRDKKRTKKKKKKKKEQENLALTKTQANNPRGVV